MHLTCILGGGGVQNFGSPMSWSRYLVMSHILYSAFHFMPTCFQPMATIHSMPELYAVVLCYLMTSSAVNKNLSTKNVTCTELVTEKSHFVFSRSGVWFPLKKVGISGYMQKFWNSKFDPVKFMYVTEHNWISSKE